MTTHKAIYWELWVKHPQRELWSFYGTYNRERTTFDRANQVREEYPDVQDVRIVERRTSIDLPLENGDDE